MSQVTRLALQIAASIAGLMLTTEALVADIKEEEKGAGCRTLGVFKGACFRSRRLFRPTGQNSIRNLFHTLRG